MTRYFFISAGNLMQILVFFCLLGPRMAFGSWMFQKVFLSLFVFVFGAMSHVLTDKNQQYSVWFLDSF